MIKLEKAVAYVKSKLVDYVREINQTKSSWTSLIITKRSKYASPFPITFLPI